MDHQEIRNMVTRYTRSIHTQEAEDFLPLWDADTLCTLISPAGYFSGVQNIYQDFLLGRIRNAYSRIELITDSIDVRFPTEDTAVVIFGYETDCDRRETGEHYGIAGLETQLYRKTAAGWKLTHVHYSVNPRS